MRSDYETSVLSLTLWAQPFSCVHETWKTLEKNPHRFEHFGFRYQKDIRRSGYLQECRLRRDILMGKFGVTTVFIGMSITNRRSRLGRLAVTHGVSINIHGDYIRLRKDGLTTFCERFTTPVCFESRRPAPRLA